MLKVLFNNIICITFKKFLNIIICLFIIKILVKKSHIFLSLILYYIYKKINGIFNYN